MKIALVCPYDFSHPGGVANHITNLYQRLTLLGNEVRVIAPTSRAVTSMGNDFVHIGKPRPLPASESIIRVPISLRLGGDIKDVLERERFDVVHLHEPFIPMLCSAVLRFSETVNIGTFHAAEAKPGYNFAWPIGRIMLRRRRGKLHGRIAVSKSAMDYAQKYIPGDYAVIPNGIDLEHFSPGTPPMQQYLDGKLNIVFVGRLEYRKGVDFLLEAYQQVKREVPDSRLIIVGPGTRLRKRYEKWVAEHEVRDVVFAGFSSYEDLPRYYMTSDVFCSPATGRESFGIVLAEAMAMGKPVVATNISGYASVVTNGEQGLLVPPKDSESLAKALYTVMRDPNLRRQMGEKGIVKAREYSWDRIAHQVLDYYTRVLGEQGVTSYRRSEPLAARKPLGAV